MLICMNDGNRQGRLAVHFPRQELMKFSHAFLFVLPQAVLSMNSESNELFSPYMMQVVDTCSAIFITGEKYHNNPWSYL